MKHKYDWLASKNQIVKLSGRLNSEDTFLRNSKIKSFIEPFLLNSKLLQGIDVGCGDASLAKSLEGKFKEFTLTVFTETEKNLLLDSNANLNLLVCNSTKIPTPKHQFNFLICNSVLHSYGNSINQIEESISEFNRVLKTGSYMFIGEIPLENSIKIKNVKNVFDYVIKYSKVYGISRSFKLIIKLLIAYVEFSDYIINDIPEFSISEKEFIELAANYGFDVICTAIDVKSMRNDYLFKKTKDC
jgi:ubiquinone/menaquinone biosynthesis C-methylase UbiE